MINEPRIGGTLLKEVGLFRVTVRLVYSVSHLSLAVDLELTLRVVINLLWLTPKG